MVDESLNDLAQRVMDMVLYNAKRDDAEDIPEYIAYELTTLAEWMAPSPDIARQVASQLVQEKDLPGNAALHIKKYFGLPA